MTLPDLQGYYEQSALAILLWRPDENRWELDGLEVSLFVRPLHRQIADALTRTRDSGRQIHWKRVRRDLLAHGFKSAAELVRPLVRAAGSTYYLTASISELHRSRADRKGRAA